jgi:hypothetical protein
MGDRGNIYVTDGSAPGVFLYGHWSGSVMCGQLQGALARRVRWHDTPYLTRIIFDAMTDGDHGSETGLGISTTICDNEYPILIVDTRTETVTIGREGVPPIPTDRSWSFDEFAVLPLDETGWPANVDLSYA